MRPKIIAAFFLCVAFPAISLLAQENIKERKRDSLQYKWERFSVSLGMFVTSVQSDISVVGLNSGIGVNVNLEEALGLRTSTFAFRGEALYNFGSRKRSHVRVGYFGVLRNSTKVLETDLTIGDYVFPVGVTVRSKYDLLIIRGVYDYAYYMDDRISLAISAGLYVLPMSYSFSTGDLIDESGDFIAPAPVLGIRNYFMITPKLLLQQTSEILYISTNKFDGNITDLNLYLEYNPFKHIGFGVGYNSFHYTLGVKRGFKRLGTFEGSLRTGFSGLLIYAKYYF